MIQGGKGDAKGKKKKERKKIIRSYSEYSIKTKIYFLKHIIELITFIFKARLCSFLPLSLSLSFRKCMCSKTSNQLVLLCEMKIKSSSITTVALGGESMDY